MTVPFSKEPLIKSQYYMIRCVIAMAHADGVIHPEEKDFINTWLEKLPLDYNQRKVIERDLEKPQDIEALFVEITEPKYRAHVVDFARMLAARDGSIKPSEQEIIDRLQLEATQNLDMDSIRESVRARLEESTTPEPRPAFSPLRSFFIRLFGE